METDKKNNFNGGPIVIDSHYTLEQNPNFREYMEDYCKITLNFNNDKNKALFALNDGHAGGEVAKLASERFAEIFSQCLNEDPTEPAKALTRGFKMLDDEFVNYDETGSTACVIYLCVEDNKRVLYSANCGDSRNIIIREKLGQRLSYDHKATDKYEIERAKKDGGLFFRGRLGGNLAVTRSLGDYSFKKDGGFGLISEPFVNKDTILDTDRYIIMASDGVWDVINEKKAYEFSKNCESAQQLSEIIVKQATILGSRDNISCIAIKLS